MNCRESSEKWPSTADFICIAMVGFYAVFMLVQAMTLTIWHDEAITLLNIAGNPGPSWPSGIVAAAAYLSVFDGTGALGNIPTMLIETDVHPPLYYFTSNLWSMVFGDDLFAVRVLSVLCAVFSLLFICRSIKNDNGGNTRGLLVALVMLCVSPTFAYVALNARGYSLGMLFLTAMIMLVHSRIAKGYDTQIRVGLSLMAIGAFGALAFLTHYMTLLAAAPLLLVITIIHIRRYPVAVVLAFIVTIVLAMLALPFLSEQLSARPMQYAGFTQWPQEVVAVILGLRFQFHEVTSGGLFSWLAIAISILLIIILITNSFRRIKTPTVFIHLSVVFGYIAGLLILYSLTDKSLVNQATFRYMVFIVPSLAILAGHLIGEVRLKDRSLAASLAVAALLICGIDTWVINNGPKSDPWRIQADISELVDGFSKHAPEHTIIIFDNKARGIVPVPLFSVRPSTPVFLAETPDDLASIKALMENKKVIYFPAMGVGEMGPAFWEFILGIEDLGFKRKGESFLWLMP